MSSFWQELFISWGGNAVLVGLIAYIGKIYFERIGRKEQASIDERLKRLEQDHEKILNKDEHFHQISQQTYQALFERKIKVYDKLLNLTIVFEKLTYPKFSQWDEMEAENRIGYLFLMSRLHTELSTTYSAIDNIISKNITVLSPQLSEKFLTWLVYFRSEFDSHNKENLDKSLKSMGEAFLSQTNSNNGQIKNLLEESEKNSYKEKINMQNIKGSLLLKNLEKFNEILEQIKKDSLMINQKINHIDL